MKRIRKATGSAADNFISKNTSGYAQFHLLSNARSVG